MTRKSGLPAIAQAERRPGIAFELPKSAVARWDPRLRPAAASSDDSVSIDILDYIGPEDWGGVSSKTVARALAGAGGKNVVVNINSPGGDMFEGIAIYNSLREYQARVTVKVLGLAASAASIIAMAGDRIEVGRTAFMMIHNVWVLAIGNRNELRAAADWIEPFDEALAALYAARTGKSKRTMAALMDAETWFGGEKAIEDGFADALLPADEVGRKDKDEDHDDDAYALMRRVDVNLLKAGLPREERGTLMNQLRGAFEAARGAATSQPAQETNMTQPTTEQPAAPAAPAPTTAPAAPAPAAAAAPDQKARIKAILALPDAKGRTAQANYLALETDVTVEQATGMLAASPKASRLDDAMQTQRPGISSQEEQDRTPKPIESAAAIYARRREIFQKAGHVR